MSRPAARPLRDGCGAHPTRARADVHRRGIVAPVNATHCTACRGPLGPIACSACGRTTVAGLRPGVWVLDRYRIQRPLTDTGMGRLWLGLDESGFEVSIAAFDDSVFRTAGARERYLTEMHRYQAYSHPNAQPTLAVGALADGAPTWVGAWRSGPTVATMIVSGPVHPSDASRVVEQVARALDALHARGLAHGDLKPETVQCAGDVAAPGDAWITEVGHLSSLVASRVGDGSGTVLGTPPYMAPERFTGAAPNAAADLYALGLLGYELYEGRSPFDGKTPWEWATAHLTRAPRPWSAAAAPLAPSPRMRAAIGRCLARDPRERFASAKAFLDAATEPAGDLFGPNPFGQGPYRGRG